MIVQLIMAESIIHIRKEHTLMGFIDTIKAKAKADKKKIVLPSPIKAVGKTEVTVKLHPKVSATLRVNVTEE